MKKTLLSAIMLCMSAIAMAQPREALAAFRRPKWNYREVSP